MPKQLTLLETRQLIESFAVSPMELVQEAAGRIKALNPAVNAVISTRIDAAMEESGKRDFSQTHFKGIPILLKGLGMNLAGEPATAGSCLLADRIARHTDCFVQKIRDLGFIVIGQTNTPEFGFKNITDPKLYGDSRHPADLAFSPGGSSGGAAAAVLSGMTALAAASDGGGSIRIPASYTGLVGLKPTRGSMPVGPGSYRGWQGASVNFFLTRDPADTEAMFLAMRTRQPEAPFYAPDPKRSTHGSFDKRKLKIAYTTQSPISSQVSPQAIAAIGRTAGLLSTLGHEVVEKEAPIDGFDLMHGYYLVNGVETANMLRGISKGNVELISWVLYQYGLSVRGAEMVDALNRWDQASAAMHRFHDTYDLYLTPSTAYTAPPLSMRYIDETTEARMNQIEEIEDKYQVVWDMFAQSLARTPFTMLANITGQPAISIPMYQDEENSALGVQFIAAKGEESLLFDISRQLEPYFQFGKQVQDINIC